MQLNELKSNPGSHKRRMRVGRGIGSGKGKTCGRGGKGFEGGQTPIHRRLPKRGFTNHMRHEYETVNLGALQKAFDAKTLDAGATVDLAALKQAGLVRKNGTEVKLLGKGTLTAKVTLQVDFASEAAKAAVEKAGGNLVIPA